MRRLVGTVALVLLGVSLVAGPAGAATGVASRLQLRGHLPELGERPTMRVFQTQAAYDSFRTSLGEANVFPASSNMFMSFDRDILALYARGNDSGGRCLRTGPNATLDGDTTTLDLQFEPGTCGAPSGAHYPFILVALARTAADGSSWVTPARSVCASAPGVADSRACASLGTSTTILRPRRRQPRVRARRLPRRQPRPPPRPRHGLLCRARRRRPPRHRRPLRQPRLSVRRLCRRDRSLPLRAPPVRRPRPRQPRAATTTSCSPPVSWASAC